MSRDKALLARRGYVGREVLERDVEQLGIFGAQLVVGRAARAVRVAAGAVARAATGARVAERRALRRVAGAENVSLTTERQANERAYREPHATPVARYSKSWSRQCAFIKCIRDKVFERGSE